MLPKLLMAKVKLVVKEAKERVMSSLNCTLLENTALPTVATPVKVPMEFRTSLGGPVALKIEESSKKMRLLTMGSAELKLAKFHLAICPSTGVVAVRRETTTKSKTLHPHGFDIFRPCEYIIHEQHHSNPKYIASSKV